MGLKLPRVGGDRFAVGGLGARGIVQGVLGVAEIIERPRVGGVGRYEGLQG